MTFVVDGVLNGGGEAAVFGAPDQASAAYEADRSLDVNLTWNPDLVRTLQGAAYDSESSWDDVLKAIKAALESVPADLAPMGD